MRYGAVVTLVVFYHLRICCVCVHSVFSSTPNSVSWRKMRGFPHLCQTSCLSWSTRITLTPGLKRWEKDEISSMHSTVAVWRTFIQSSTTGCTVTSTRCACFSWSCFWPQIQIIHLLSDVQAYICSIWFDVCRTPYLERGPTSPVTSAWPFCTVPTATAGERAFWVLSSAVSPCVKLLIIQTWNARWREKVSLDLWLPKKN